MLSKRVFFILFLLVITIGTLSSVSADDIDGDVLSNVSQDEMGISNDVNDSDVEIVEVEEDEVLDVPDSGSFTALKSKILSAEPGSTIELENDYYYNDDTDYNTVPMIIRSLTINGNGHVIDGAYSSALLRVLGKIDVTLNNITFRNGYNDEVIRIDNMKSVVFNDCIFENNEGYFGGALVATNSSSVSFNRCGFFNNNGYKGGALHLDDVESLTISDCLFGFNYAIYGGSVCSIYHKKVYITDSYFINNTANNTGGALYFEAGNGVDVYNCYIANNSAYYGGAIGNFNSSDFKSRSVTFERNSAHYGGAVCLSGYDGASVKDCKFEYNSALKLVNGATAGAIYVEKGKKFSLIHTYFTENTAVSGGCIYLGNAYDSLIDSCIFESNYGFYYGGVINFNNNVNKLKMTSSKFTGNYAFWGGALYFLTADDCKIESCNFSSNQAVASDTGGAGGAVYLAESYNMEFDYCNFNENYAKNYGGAVSLLNSNNCRFNYCNFNSCFAPNCGAVITANSPTTFTKCSFIDNWATEYIGALYGGTAINCVFSGNTYPQTVDTTIISDVNLQVTSSGSNCDNMVVTATVTNANDGSAVAGQYVTFNLNGNPVKVITNSEGRAVLKANLPSKSYSGTVSLSGSANYYPASKNVNVVVKKATPKLIASKKTFKAKVKIKKYTVTLKDSLGRAIKNVKLTIKVKGKTYSAKTNAKGQATFKIKKLTKKGKHKATVKFAGNAFYNAVSKTVKITVKK